MALGHAIKFDEWQHPAIRRGTVCCSVLYHQSQATIEITVTCVLSHFNGFHHKTSLMHCSNSETRNSSADEKGERYQLNHAIVVELYHHYTQFPRNVRLPHHCYKRCITQSWQPTSYLNAFLNYWLILRKIFIFLQLSTTNYGPKTLPLQNMHWRQPLINN